MNFTFWLGQREFRLTFEPEKENFLRVVLGEKEYNVSVEFISPEELLLNVDGKVFNIIVSSNSSSHSVFVNGEFFKVEKKSALKLLKEVKGKLKKRDVKISMPGRVVDIMANLNDEVKEGQPILVLEAMKMQNEIKAPQAGRITKLNIQPGDYVETGSVLFSVE